MQLVRHYPFTRHNSFNHLFNGWHDAASNRTNSGPAVDITELENAYQVVVDVPGKSASDIDVSVEKQVLTIATKADQSGDGSDTEQKQLYTRQERASGEFERRFTLPDSVEVDGIKADCSHGVLTVTIPKSTESAIRKISVNG
ncbi:MAG: Hsp20/alpha crystallin family protein [Gammaproteobacteria bacterium]|nr:Hsp20/alpha crystallin family protein [Gammaproteobacteria bacterium]